MKPGKLLCSIFLKPFALDRAQTTTDFEMSEMR